MRSMVVVGAIVLLAVAVAFALGRRNGDTTLNTLANSPMSSPVLSFTEPVDVVRVERTGAGALPTPARLTTFFAFDEGQRDLAVEELLAQATDVGFDLENQLPESDWPLAKYTATNDKDIKLSITVSAENVGVQLT